MNDHSSLLLTDQSLLHLQDIYVDMSKESLFWGETMEDKSLPITGKRRFTELDRRFFVASASGLIAINTVILQAFISAGTLDIPETISIFALAIALPMLASFIVIVAFSWREFHTLLENTMVAATYMIGSFSAFIAIAATLCHISWIACILFVVSAIAAYILYYEARTIK